MTEDEPEAGDPGDSGLGCRAGDRAGGERGYIYVVEPTGPFEDDPNVTNKKFPGNITQSSRTPHPMEVVAEVETWEGHPPTSAGTDARQHRTTPSTGSRRHRGLTSTG